jgi:hypothetical protein
MPHFPAIAPLRVAIRTESALTSSRDFRDLELGRGGAGRDCPRRGRSIESPRDVPWVMRNRLLLRRIEASAHKERVLASLDRRAGDSWYE